MGSCDAINLGPIDFEPDAKKIVEIFLIL